VAESKTRQSARTDLENNKKLGYRKQYARQLKAIPLKPYHCRGVPIDPYDLFHPVIG